MNTVRICGRSRRFLMMIRKSIILIFLLILMGCENVAIAPDDEEILDDKPIVDQPRELILDYTKFENPFGYASLGITDRLSISESSIAVVQNELEFIEALNNQYIRIINIVSDLNLGFYYLQETYGNAFLESNNDVIRKHSKSPLLHPELLEQGVSQIRVQNRSDLTLYSENGITISHATFSMRDCQNVMIRNIHFTGIWEWDELSEGGYKRNDWDYFTLQDVNGIWFDHLTFDQAYDGIIDLKENSQNVTLSWSTLLFKPNSFVVNQINYLEENIEDYDFYKSLRDSGMSIEDVIRYASYQKKGFNIGNTTDGEGFENITITFHHLNVFNLQDRMPRIRKGDAHLYHIIVDNTELYELRLKISQYGISMVNQGIVTTEDGSVLMEHSIFKFVDTPIKNHQDSNPDVKYSGKYKVINSELQRYGRTYFGSNDDKNSIWIQSNQHETIEFSFRNYETLPYNYSLMDVYFLKEFFETYPVGHQYIEDFNWLYINTNAYK